MTTLEIILAVLCFYLLGYDLLLSLQCDEQAIQIKHDEQWKVAADRRIKELQEENLNQIEI